MTIDMATIKLVISDVDGSLVKTKSGATFRKTADDWQWLPGRLEKLQELHRQGKRLSFASNQGGVAYGYMEETDIIEQLYIMVSQIMGESKPEYFYMGVCFTHPKASLPEYRQDDQRRKPGPGMLLEAMEHCHVEPEQTLMVGDRPEDEEAAKAAGCVFMWSEAFFREM